MQVLRARQPADLGNDPIGKLLFRLAVPSICAQVVNMLYNMVDRIYIGHIPDVGAAALTGVGVTFPVILLISAFAALVGMGGAPRASIHLGANEPQKAEQILGNCCTALVLIALGLTVFFLRFQETLLCAFGASADTLPYALSYLNIYVCGTLFVQLALGMNQFLSAQGMAGMGMLTIIIGAVLNLLLDPIFIFALHLGVRGAALATVLSQAVSAVWVVWTLCSKRCRLRLSVKNLRLRANVILPVLALGASPFVMQSTESLLSIAFNTSMQKYGGDIAVGAMTILNSIWQMISMPLMGLTAGAQPILGFNFGARKPERMRKTVSVLLKTALTYTTICWLIAQLFPSVLAGFFIKSADTELFAFTTWAIHIYFATVFIMAIQNCLQQSFIALGETKLSLLLALERKIVLLIPVILILPHFFENKVFAVLLAEPVSDMIAAATVFFLFRKRFHALLQSIPSQPES